MESIAKVFSAADECVAERKERMRKLEMELEDRRVERKDGQEKQMLPFLARVLQSMSAGYTQGSVFFRNKFFRGESMFPELGGGGWT